MAGGGIRSVLSALLGAQLLASACAPASQQPEASGIHKIKHVVVIMQENRSFDHYFGTFPGAEGIPMKDGVPAVCNPDPKAGQCVKPYHDSNDANTGGPHNRPAMGDQIDGGKMDGFIAAAEAANNQACEMVNNPACRTFVGRESEVMAYHDNRELPNYWAYAKSFVLQDHMFQPAASWSLTDHLYMVSGWSASCTTPGDPFSCRDDGDLDYHAVESAPPPGRGGQQPVYDFPWTDLTYLLHHNHVSWKYYVAEGVGAYVEVDPPHRIVFTWGSWATWSCLQGAAS